MSVGETHWIDLHCHCLPDIDDGPACLEEALTLCRALVSDGIGTVVATPHQLGRFEGYCNAQDIRAATQALNQALKSNRIDLHVLPGAEVRVDERIMALLESDYLLTMADQGKYVCLELPYDVFLDIGSLLSLMKPKGIEVIIAHPERQRTIASNPQLVMNWADYDPVLEITCASLVGRFGSAIRNAAWALLELPLNAVVATDAHDTESRAPMMRAAFTAIEKRLGLERAQQLCREQALQIIGDVV